MKGYTYVHNCLFDWYYEHEEKDMTEADLIIYIALQLGMENQKNNTLSSISDLTGYSETQVSQSLRKLRGFNGKSNCKYKGFNIELNKDGDNILRRLVDQKKNTKEKVWIPNFLPSHGDKLGEIKPVLTTYFVVTDADFDLLKDGILTRTEFVTYLFLLKAHKYEKEIESQLWFRRSTVAKKLKRSTLTVSKHIRKFLNTNIEGIPLIEEEKHPSYEAKVEIGEEPSFIVTPTYNLNIYKRLKNNIGSIRGTENMDKKELYIIKKEDAAKYVHRVDVIDKVRELKMTWGKYTSIKFLAEYFDVTESTITTQIRRYFKEFKRDGVKKLEAWDLETFKRKYNLNRVSKSLYIVTKEAVIRLAIINKRSDVAVEIRKELLELSTNLPVQIKASSSVEENKPTTEINVQNLNVISVQDVVESHNILRNDIQSIFISLKDEIESTKLMVTRSTKETIALKSEVKILTESNLKLNDLVDAKKSENQLLERKIKSQNKKIRKMERIIANRAIGESGEDNLVSITSVNEPEKGTVLKMDRNGNLEKLN
ncbi:hypothetical protein NSU09_12680 [Bacillus sp. PS194]|uniref:hypothetical protein n=1 Tax=Bacillus TaxID=1386 RepID=UPI00129D746F|nr:hypothetical protein [Bacillus subtilis]MBL3637588.1 hypothetical protein [Alkalicoccobacillus gibsonii]QGI09337.1 hypothetical protein GII79_11295 [Bacillus subtilis]QGI17929.1 hypothetical protein GII81_11525 [Bacillus subtilis]CAF1772952.1 hypothetical protein NRS6103_03908 [Bacillus subtilis]CAI6276294.1 hypothetical protein NRS6103_11285 [Bacillus subtilis]